MECTRRTGPWYTHNICNFDFKMFNSLGNDFLNHNEMNKQDNTQRVLWSKAKSCTWCIFFYSHISSFFFLPIYLTASKRRGEKKRVLMRGCRPPKEAKLRSPKIKTVSKDRKKCTKASAIILDIKESSNHSALISRLAKYSEV